MFAVSSTQRTKILQCSSEYIPVSYVFLILKKSVYIQGALQGFIQYKKKKKSKVQVLPLVALSKKDSSCPAEHQPAAWWILMPKHNELWSFPVAEQDPGSSPALSAAAHSRWMPSIQSTLKKEMKYFSCFSLWLLPAFTQTLPVFGILVVVHRNVTSKSRYPWRWHIVT